MHQGGHQQMSGRKEMPTNRDVDAAAEAFSPVSASSDPISAENSDATELLRSGNVGEAKKNASKELADSELAEQPKATANIEIAHTADSPGIHKSGLAAESTHTSGRVSLQDQKPDYRVEGAVSAVFAAASVAGAEQEQEAPPRNNQEGGRASSVLSRILSALLRQLLPWVLPSAVQGASAEDVKVNISRKQVTLSGVSLEPQELTALTGAPLHLLHCSIRELQLQVGRKEEADDVAVASLASITTPSQCSQTPAHTICEGNPVSPSVPAASAGGAMRCPGKGASSTIFFSAKDVILVLTPTSPHEWSRRQLLEQALQRRRSLLYSMDNELQQQLERRSYFPLCLSSLISHWVDRNIQWACLDLNNLHLRIEFLVPPLNSTKTASFAFALGLTLEELRIRNIPVDEPKGPPKCATYECQQQQNNQEAMAAASTQTAEAAAEPSPNSDPSGNCSSNRQGSVCSEFEIIGCSVYVQNELLLLAPHTCTVAEILERLGAVRVEHKQDGHPKPEQATNEQRQPNQNYQIHRGCSLQTSHQKKPRCRTPKFIRSLLAPVGVHVLLRKKAIAAHPSEKGDKRSSSMASWTGSSSNGSVVTAFNTASSADPSYVAFVESDCVEVTFTPEVVQGLRWLAANFEAHRRGVDAAEAVLSLVRPFVPSCTVHRNPRIWWRFAIRAICRLQRNRLCVLNTSSSNVAVSAQFDISGHGVTVEEILKRRLCIEKAATYRRLRLCQLEGTLTHQQLDQLIHLRDSLPLPLLLQSHGASRQDFMDQQSKTGATGVPKAWGRWFTVWKRRSPQQGFTTETNTLSPGEAGAALRKGHFARPPVPPLSLQSLLDRHNMDRQRHQLTPQNGEQHQRSQGDHRATNPDGGKCLGGLDDFFDARSQPATARISSSRLRLHEGLGEGSTPALMYATLEEPRNPFQIPAQTPEEQDPIPPPLEMTDSGDAYTGEVPSQEGDVSGAPAPPRSNSDDNLGVGDDFSEEDDTFYDCLDLQTPRCTAQATLHSGASGTSRMPLNTVQNPVLFSDASEQVECTISVSIFLRSASFACCLDELNPSNAESQSKRRGHLQKQQQGMQQAAGNSILCCIGALRVSGVVGTEMLEGSVSVDRLDINFKDGGLYRDQKVLMAPETGSGPILSLQICRNPINAASAPIVNGKDRFPQRREPSPTIRNSGGDERPEQSYIFLSLKVCRIICVVDPLVLKETLTLKNGFSNAAAAAVSAATKASRQCSLLHLGGWTNPGHQCSGNFNVGPCRVESTYGNMHLQWRILHPSPRRHQPLCDGASLHYEVFVEAPTIIVPSSAGRAVLCHLGELRVCSAHLEQEQLLCTQGRGVKEPPRLTFADSVFQEKYMHTLKTRRLPAAPKEVGGAARDSSDQPLLRHVSLRTHHGLLLKDFHLLIHNSMEQLKRELTLQQCVGCGGSLRSSGFQSTHRPTHWEDTSHVRPLIQQQGQTRSANSCGVEKEVEGSAGGGLGYSATWGVCGSMQTVLFPSEFVAAVEVEQVGILSREVALKPFRLAVHPEKWRRGRHSESRESPVELLPSRTCAGKEDPGKQEIPQSVRQPKQRQHQEQQRSKACDPWEQRLCGVKVHVSGKCSEVSASLSRHSCAVMLSAFQSMKSAFLGNEVTAVSAGCPSHDRTFWMDAEGSSSLNQGCDDLQEGEGEESSSIVPVKVDLSLEWGKLGVYLHHLEDSIEGQKPADGRDASPSRVGKDTANATDSLQLQAAGVSAHFSSGNCEMVGRLELKQLLLEQPSFQEESINRYILCVPSTDLCSAAERIGATFPGGPCIVLAFTNKPGNTRAPTTASVRILRPMTLNFRPTPVTWFVSFLGAPFERCVDTGGRNTCSGEGSCSDGTSSQSPHVARSQRNTNNGRVRQFGEVVDATLEGICLSPEIGAAKPQPTKILSASSDSRAHCDPVLREILVEFERVDFLWCTRGSDKPLATASVSAASASLHLCRYSTKFTGSVKDFTLHFVIPGVRSEMAAIPSSGCRWKHTGRFQRRQMPCDVPFEHCADESRVQNQFPKAAILQVTEIIGLVPGRSYALRLTLESMHPLSPLFSGFSSYLKLDVGTCRVVYVHPKFWRLFDWMVDEFIGTLTSQPPAASPPREMRSGNRSTSEETLPKRIERSPSLEDLAVRSVLQSAAAVGVGAPCSANSDKGEFMNEDIDTRVAQEQPFLVPNEGLRRIFLLADAGRSIAGLPPLLHESLQGPGGGMSRGENKLHRLVLPQTLPFGAFHYEIQITSPRILLPASSRPDSRISLWPPVCFMKDLNGDPLVCDECSSTMNRFIGRDVAACTKSRDYLAASESSTQASGREVVCFVDCVTVSNSWNLSRGHGIVESINVAFKGAKAFAKIGDFSHGLGKSPFSASARQGDMHHRESYTASRREGRCRRCIRRVPVSAPSSMGGPSHCPCNSPTTMAARMIEAAASPGYPGRYLLGNADLVIRMFRPVLLRSSSRWLRVETGCLPLTLDVHTLELLFDIVENNITATDPDIAAQNAEAPLLTSTLTRHSRGRHALRAKRRAEGISISNSHVRFSPCPPVAEASYGTATRTSEVDITGLIQQLLGNHILQGLLEPQVDFIELLEEWGQETILVELVIEGLHLAVCEQPLKKQIVLMRKHCGALRHCIRAMECCQGMWPNDSNIGGYSVQEGGNQMLSVYGLKHRKPLLLFHALHLRAQLRSLRLQPEKAEQVGLLLPSATLPPPLTSLLAFGDEKLIMDKARTTQSPPVTGTFVRMIAGSSTLFAPELAPPFAVIFTNSGCAEGLSLQLEPLADSIRQAEHDAVAAAAAIARMDGYLASKAEVASNPEQNEGEDGEPMEKQLSGNSQEPLLEGEHLLVAPFASPWIDPLQMHSQTQDSPSDEDELTSRESVTTGSGGGATEGGRFHSRRSGEFSMRSVSVDASSAPLFEIPPCSRDYEVVFRCGIKPGQEQTSARPRVPPQSCVLQPTKLSVMYKSATAVPVIPLSGGCMSTVSKNCKATHGEKIQILQRLLLQRQHRRKQQRIAVSSRRPRCVLSLALLSRISAFLSSNEATNKGIPTAVDVSGGSTPALMPRRESWQGMRRVGSVATSRHNRFTCRGKNKVTGEYTAEQANKTDSAVGNRTCSISNATDHTEMLGSGALSGGAEPMHVGRRAVTLRRSSFDSAKLFSTGLSNRCSSEMLSATYAQDAPTGGNSHESGCETSSEPIESNEVDINDMLSLRLSCSPKEDTAAATQKREELTPLQLNSTELAVRFSEASVLLPVDSANCESSSVLLRGSVNFCRRADDVRDPLRPHGISKDAQLAAGAYAHILSGYRKGKTQSFWVCGPSRSAASGEEVGTGGILHEQESFWQDTTQFVEKLPDRFCPGARGVDVLVQKAAVSCLHQSAPLHQHCASTGGQRTNSDLRNARRLRWTSRRSTCASAPAKKSKRLKVEEASNKFLLPDELRCAAGKEETEAYMKRVRSDSLSSLHAAGNSLHFAPVRSLGNFQCHDKVYGGAAPHKDCLKVTKSASSVAEIHSTPRSICSGLQAHITRVFMSPAPRCHRQESDVAQIVSDAAQGGNGDACGVTDDSQQQYSVGRAHESCCCCLMNGESSRSVGMGGGTSALACDCCCHHPQEYTSLQLSPCEVELSHLDMILMWHCAAEQTVQLQQQQRRQQAQVTVLQRLLHRSAILKQRLCAKQRLLHKHLMETASQIPALPASVALKPPSAVLSASQRPVLGRMLFPTAAAGSSLQRNRRLPQTNPGHRYLSARLSLMRVTLLDDHLDCLKAPLLQLLVPNCRFSQASSLLPPQSTDTPRVFRQGRSQKQEISSVSLLTVSLRLWAFNPLTVAFEPVVESLPLSLVVREAPYSLMRATYSSCCDDDSLALNVGQGVAGSRGELHKTWRSPPSPSTHGNDPRTLLEMASSPATTPNEKMSSSNDNANSNSTSSGYDLAGARSPLPSRKACAIVKQQTQGPRPSEPATTFSAKSSRTGLSLGAHMSGEATLRNTKLPGNQSIFWDSGTEGAMDALGCVECVSPGDEVSSSRRYVGISVSSTAGSSIEANLSPLLLQSVLRTICRWHYEFTHQVQHQQQQWERKEYSSFIFRTTGAKLPEMCSHSPSQQQHQEPLQYQEEGTLTYVKSQCTGGQTAQPWSAQDGPDAREQRLSAEARRLQKRPSRSIDAFPIPAYPNQDRHTGRHHSLPAALPRGETDWRFGIQLRQKERQSVLEADEPKQGKLFFAYQVVNQTGLYLGILLLPTQADFGEHGEALCGANATQVAAAAQLGLPQTLRQCRRYNKNVGVYEDDESSGGSRSSTSEAEAGRALSSAPIYWDFGSNLQNVTSGSPGSVDAASESVKGTLSCPSSPSSDQDGKPVYFEASVDSSSWGWLQPSEERALTQMKVSVGTASSAHVALQLAKQPTRAIPWVTNTLCMTALQAEKWNNDETDFHADGSCKRWKLRMPVPLDRVGVYIQPLEDMKKTAFSGATVSTSSADEQKVPYVVCRLMADGGTKQLLVQSQVLLRSSCSVPLQARLLPSLESSGIGLEKNHRTFEDSEESEQLADLLVKPGETSAVPVDFCFTGRLRIRPVHAGEAYSWSKDLSLDMLWRVVDGTEQEKNAGSGAGGEAGQAGSKRSLPKTGMLRCCRLIKGSRSCPARDPVPTDGVSPEGGKWEGSRNLREPDYHIMVRYCLERLVHLSFSCIQLKLSFEAPLQLSSNIPFPVRYRISCPLVLRAGEVPPGDSEGVLQLNKWQQLHSFPLSGVAFLSISIAEGRWTKRTQIHPRPIQRRRPPPASPQAAAAGPSAGLAATKGSAQAPADCVTGSGTEAGKRESAEDKMAGETIVEVECLDSQHRSAKVWLIFCDFGGGSPCLLLHSPIWLVSHIQWALQKQWLKQPQQQNQDGAETQITELPAVEYSVIRRSNPSELGWAMQAVSAAAAAVDFNRHTEQRKPAQLPNFTGSGGVMKDPNEGIRLLDFTASSIRVEVDGIGCSQFLDVWGDFPRRLSVSALYTEDVAAGSKDRATVSECNVLRQTCSVPASPCEERSSPLGSALGGPCIDIVATMSEAPFPLLRPVLLLTLSPVYTITSQCPFPIRVRQARSGSHCSRIDAGSADFTLHIQPQHTEAFVWQYKDGSRFLQLQGLMPTLCWLQGGCRCRLSTPFDGGFREAVWSAWSGYSPFCLPGDDWCLRLPSAPSVAPMTNEDGPAASDLPLRWGQCEAGNTGSGYEQMLEGEQFPIPAVEPQDLVRALLRRGVSVKSSGKQADTKRPIRGRLARRAFSGSQCSALRLCSSEGPASTVNLTVQTETFDMRDTVSICNSTPLPLLLRQCHHGDTEGGMKTDPQPYQESAVAQKLGLTEAAAFGVDSVAAAVAELWGAATQGEGLQQHQTSLDTADSFAKHAACSMGDHSRSSQLLNMLLEAQQCGESQSNTKRPPGASSFHSCEKVYISAAPHEEGIHAQLDMLARVAQAVVAQTAAEQQHPQNEVDNAGVLSAGKHCCWCIFEHAVSQELCAMRGEATEGAEIGEGDAATSKLSLLPQLVLPGETVLFTWDDYRCLSCIELTYFPWLQQYSEKNSSDFTKEPCTSNRDEAVPPVMEYPSFDTPFVVCIPLRPDVRGVVPLSPLPSSSWPIFRVVRRAGSLLLQIAPAGDILGLTSSSPHGVAQPKHEGTRLQLSTKNSRVSAGSNVVNSRAGSFISPWADGDSDQVPASRSDVDVGTLLTVPRYFELPIVNKDLTAVCSRCRETSRGCDGCVPPWSFASMCRFAGSVVGSYAPDQGGDPASARAFHPVTADINGGHTRNLVLPMQPTPDPPIFEFRIEAPRLQLSVLSQSAITDPLSRETLRLPEELFLATLEGFSAAYICSPFHTAAACRVQELQVASFPGVFLDRFNLKTSSDVSDTMLGLAFAQIDSMHSQAYYPVLLQRAPPMPSETGAAIDSTTTEPSRITSSTHKNQEEGDGGGGGGSLHAAGRMSKDDGGALVEFLLQQRLPFYGTRDDGVVVIDKCSLSLKPVSIRTDLKSVYMASEAMNCWTSAWAASISSMNLLYPETTVSTPVFHHQIRPPRPYEEILETSDWRRGSASADDEELEYHYDIRSGLSWACKGWNCRPSPISAFASQVAGTCSAVFPITLAVRPWLFKLTKSSLRLSTLNQKREQRYIFRTLTIASTCVVLSFKADTGGNSSALRRSVVTLSSLEDARFEVDGLQVTGRRLMGKVQELNQHKRPPMHQDCSRLTKLTGHHRHPTVSLRDVARVVGHFYQQQLLSHLSKLLVSVDLLGNPALSFAHLQAGVYALAKQPMAAAETGGDVFEGMMRGAEDFLKHTGYGFFGGISRMAGVASDSLGALACDEVYVHTRKQQGRHKARNVEEGLQQGVEALGRALAGGITGLVEEPVRGAAEGGFEGLLRGAGRGIAGFLVKPLTGVLDLAQKTAEAIKDASQVEGHQRPRLRLPRLLLGDLRLLVAYDAQAAEAKAILTDAEGQYWENLPVLFFALDHRLQALTVLTASSILLFTHYSRNHNELRFLAPLSCVLAVGHCSTPNRSTSSSRSRTLSTSPSHRHAVVLQLRQEGESRVYYQQLTYSNTRIQVHILNSLKQLLLQ